MKASDSLAKVGCGAAVDVIRAFNRLYTRQLGLLDQGLLGSEFTLTEARILYELANRDESTATQIARELAIDLGYMSRIIKKFERRRLIKRIRSALDARQSRLLLTEKGRAAFDPLDRAAKQQIAAMVEPMSRPGAPSCWRPCAASSVSLSPRRIEKRRRTPFDRRESATSAG